MSGIVRNHGWPVQTIALLASLFVLSFEAAADSNFVLIELPRGVELQIPKGWWLLGADYNRAIQTSIEAAMDLSGIGLPDGQESNLIAANSMPTSTYAAVRVDSTIPPSVSPTELSSITATDVRELHSQQAKKSESICHTENRRSRYGNLLSEKFGSLSL